LFSLFPIPSFRWRYISLNTKVLAANTQQKPDVDYKDYVKVFLDVFDFSKLGYHTY
ncbi:MAG: hypothetical protein EXX96DRAFT_454230, partial [Benjaminiella poitrasii]